MERHENSNIILPGNLLLRTLEPRDSLSFYNLYKKNYETKLAEESPFQPGETEADFTARILGLCTHIWTIRLSDDPQTIVGDAALHDWIKETSTIEIGGTLLPEYHGKGIMISVFDYIISFAKEQLNIKTIIGKTGINNQQAARLVLKLGFTRSNESDGLAVFQKILE